MQETDAELDRLQDMLDTSLAGSTSHLRSIIKPGSSTLTARQLVRVLTGMCIVAISTVTAKGEPRISAVDGHFLHGTWIFGTERSAAKARQLKARPAVSLAHIRGEELGVFTHGTAELLNPVEGPADPEWDAIHEYLTGHYGESPMNWGDSVYYRVSPHWMTAYAPNAERLLAE